MVTLSWLVVTVRMKDGWRYALTTGGDQWRMIDGAPMKLKLSVGNLATLLTVRDRFKKKGKSVNFIHLWPSRGSGPQNRIRSFGECGMQW